MSESQQPIFFCEVILPLAVKGTYTYQVPKGWKNEVQIGSRVEVQFGRRKHYTGLIKSIHQQKPQAYQAKELLGLVDSFPIVTQRQLDFWDWVSKYYCCELGEVMAAALPAYFRPDSETRYVLHPECKVDILELPDEEYMVASALQNQDSLKLEDIKLILQKEAVQKIIKSLIEREVMVLEEFVEEKYKPLTEVYVRLSPDYWKNNQVIPQIFKILEKSPKQTELLLAFLTKSISNQWISRNELLKSSGISGSILGTLVNKQIFLLTHKEISRVDKEKLHQQDISLSEEQTIACEEIKEFWEEKEVVLLRGVTASGKTHVYAHLLKEVITQGKQVLYLVPEIALTTQLIKRLRILLGDIGVYHSKFNPAERVETWLKVFKQEYNIIVGARSALFLPFQDLGLIIVDEEHDGSYKQSNPAPRYQARDAAIYVAIQHRAKVLLGSATPSIESWANAHAGKYGYVELTKRYGSMQLPELQFANLVLARKNNQMTGMLSDTLQSAIKQVLSKKKQVIIFQNRRGYAPYISCKDCAWVPECPQCDVGLTFHKYSGQLKCHYCGYSTAMPRQCPVCSSTLLEMKGAGTERVEDDLHAIFPEARLLRLDYDTAKGKKAYERIIDKFEEHEADVLIGTQMVTKGLDFEDVQLVGVLNADSLLYYPDFRALERAYQLLSQVSGRAGRSDEVGKVIIQISNIKHPIVELLEQTDIKTYYKLETAERKKFRYPPFVRMIHLSFRDTQENITQEAASFFFKQLKPRVTGDVLGPSAPYMSRIQGKYIREILIKLDREANLINTAKAAIEETRQLLYQYERFRKVRIIIDVDP